MAEEQRVSRARPLLAEAASAGVRLAALGGVAVQMLCPSAGPGGRRHRPLADVDLVTVSADKVKCAELIERHGFAPETRFNAMNGSERLRYQDHDHSHLDVFVDDMRLCHRIEWEKVLQPGMLTLPLPELVLTKLQVVAFEAKDRNDAAALLQDCWPELEREKDRLLRLVGGDWGLWRTSKGNLETLAAEEDGEVTERARIMLAWWTQAPTSVRHRLRGLVGERLRWYQEPEEV